MRSFDSEARLFDLEKSLPILAPKKETRADVIDALGVIGIDVEDTGAEFARAKNADVIVLFARDGDIPGLVDNPNTPFSLGFSGSDSSWEVLGQDPDGADKGNEFPIYELNPTAKRSRLYVGVTPEYRGLMESQGGGLDILDGSMVSTGLPRITNDYFSAQGVNVKPFGISGSDEIFPHLVPGVDAVLGVISSGTATRRTRIEVIRDPIHVVTMREHVRPEKMNDKQMRVYNGIQEGLSNVLDRKGAPRQTLVAAGLL